MSIINPGPRAELEAAIDAMIAGPPAASYGTDKNPEPRSTFTEGGPVERAAGVADHRVGCTGDGGSDGEDCGCPPQRPDPVSEKACFDAAAMRTAIATLVRLEAEYQPIHRYKTPGVGPCPRGKCVDCWGAGYEVASAAKRYVDLCRRHGDFRKRNGYPIPSLVTRALKETDWDWGNWRVVQAQKSA